MERTKPTTGQGNGASVSGTSRVPGREALGAQGTKGGGFARAGPHSGLSFSSPGSWLSGIASQRDDSELSSLSGSFTRAEGNDGREQGPESKVCHRRCYGLGCCLPGGRRVSNESGRLLRPLDSLSGPFGLSHATRVTMRRAATSRWRR